MIDKLYLMYRSFVVTKLGFKPNYCKEMIVVPDLEHYYGGYLYILGESDGKHLVKATTDYIPDYVDKIKYVWNSDAKVEFKSVELCEVEKLQEIESLSYKPVEYKTSVEVYYAPVEKVVELVSKFSSVIAVDECIDSQGVKITKVIFNDGNMYKDIELLVDSIEKYYRPKAPRMWR